MKPEFFYDKNKYTRVDNNSIEIITKNKINSSICYGECKLNRRILYKGL